MKASFSLGPVGFDALGPLAWARIRLSGGTWSTQRLQSLVDTGASTCVMRDDVARCVLGMDDAAVRRGDPVRIGGTTGERPGYTHVIDVALEHARGRFELLALRVVVMPMNLRYQILLGQRDALDRVVFVQNAPARRPYFVMSVETGSR